LIHPGGFTCAEESQDFWLCRDGIINYKHLLSTALSNGMKYFFVEQSRLYHETALQSAAVNEKYLRNLRLEKA
jgi:hypothetical protein